MVGGRLRRTEQGAESLQELSPDVRFPHFGTREKNVERMVGRFEAAVWPIHSTSTP